MEIFTVLRVLLLLYLAHKGKFLSIPYNPGKIKFLPGKILSSVLLFSFNDFYSCFDSYKGRFRVNTASLRIGLNLTFINLGSCLRVTVETSVLKQRQILSGNKLL